MGATFQVSWIQFQIPNHAKGVTTPTNPIPTCGCGCGCCGAGKPGGPPAGPNASYASSGPIRYGTGEVVLSATDLGTQGFGFPWGHTRSFASQLSESTNIGNGYNWQVRDWTYLVIQDSGTVAVMGQANQVLWFDPIGNAFVPRFSITQTLLSDPVNNVYRLIDLDGSVTVYSATSGAFLSHTDPAGNQVAVVSYTSNGFNFAEVQRRYTDPTSGITTVESFLYGYVDATAAYPLLSSVTLRRQVGSGSWANVSQVLYTYYGTGEPYGASGDLKTAVTQVWESGAWVATGTTYYRYYQGPPFGSSSSSSSLSSGSSSSASAAHLLKYVVNPASYDRLAADPTVPNPLTATDAQVAQYADYYFEYDANYRVTKEAVQGGSRTFQFATVPSGNANGYNSWAYKTTETLPDGSQNIVYTNYAAQPMLKVFQSGGSQWCEFFLYNAQAQLVLQANPSAVSGFNEQYADLLHQVNGNYQYLNDTTGLIHTYQYHTPTGFLAEESIQQGELGTPVLLRQYQYTSCAASSSSSSSASSSSSGPALSVPPTYFLAQEILYPNDPTAGPCGAPSSSSSSSSSSSGALRQIVTAYAYTWYPATCQVQHRITTLPVIPASQNGSGVADTRRDYYDVYGNLTWHMDERGFLTRTSYDVATQAVTQRIDDVDTTQVSDAPPGWVTPQGGGLHLTTDFQFDNEGRITQTLGPSHTIDIGGVATTVRRADWTVYQDGSSQVWTGQGYATGSAPNYSYTLVNPVSITKSDKAGQTLESIQAVRAATVGALQPTDSFPQSSYVRWTTNQYTNGYFLASQRVYKLIPASGTGVSGTHYDETDFGYDVMKRQNRSVTPGGTITRTVFDPRGNAVQIFVGTNDAGATDGDPTGGGAPGNNMVLVTQNTYDNGLAGGDNNQTQHTQYVDASTTRVTAYLYDWRNRRTDTDGEVNFCEKVCYDNLDRVIEVRRYDTTLSGNLVARQVTNYDDRSRLYQRLVYGVDPTTGTIGNSLVDNTWYDPAGNVLKSLPSGAQLSTKGTFDGLNRQLVQYTGYDLTETSYADAGSVADDTILEQVETAYDPASNVIQTTSRQRYHNATGTGSLGSPSSAQPLARVTYVAQYPDALGRTIATADYGTNGGTALVRPPTIPARSDTVLVTSMQYDNAGAVQTLTDPAGTTSCFTHDSAGREVQRILNCVGSSSSSSSSTAGSSSSASSSSSSSGLPGPCPPSDDKNVTILTGYNADGNVSSVTAVNAATGNQVTQYVYGTTLADSSVASSLLKRYEIYPDSVGGSDQVAFQYNRQGEITAVTDQNGTVHSYDYDLLGRRTQDRVTTAGTGIDTTVLRIATTYEVRGMVQKVTSYDHATVGAGNVVNDVQLSYNAFGQLTADYQSHSGAVNTALTPQVQYGYADASANTIRPTSMTYPNGRVLNYNYGSLGGTADAASRIASYLDNDGATHMADYSYLGQSSIVEVNEPQPTLKYTLVGTAGGNDPDTGDIYRGLDRFARIKDLEWFNTTTWADVERVQHGYDRASNRLWRRNPLDPNRVHDEFYTSDGLCRLNDMQRGTLNAAKTVISPKTYEQCWTLDSIGNWQNLRQDTTGNGVWDLVQGRVSNPVNEIALINITVGTGWVTPAYDPAGNTKTMPQPGSPGSTYTAVYDGWNRLTALSVGGSQVAAYQYDGLRRRSVKQTYTAGALRKTRDYYYSPEWQVLEERVGSSPTAERQFVWGRRNVDDLLLRDRDAISAGNLTERLYGIQDPNWNLTTAVDGTGNTQERYWYDPYGLPTVLSPAFVARPATMFDWETRYAAYRWENDTGLYYVRARYLHAALGCFLTRDFPDASSSPSFNLYGYAYANPISLVDPSGHQVEISPITQVPPGSTSPKIPPYAPPWWQRVAGPVNLGGIIIGAGTYLGLEWLEAEISLSEEIQNEASREVCRALTRRARMRRSKQKGGPCKFYNAWCIWGVTHSPGNPRWTETIGQCTDCYEKCLAAGDKWDSWPFQECPISGTDPTRKARPGHKAPPRWPRPNEPFPWPPIWP